MLVIVHNGYVECALQSFFYVETLRGLDVLKVDAAKSWCDFLYCLAKLFRVFLGHLDVKNVYASVNLE